jgi:hypothetical protein
MSPLIITIIMILAVYYIIVSAWLIDDCFYSMREFLFCLIPMGMIILSIAKAIKRLKKDSKKITANDIYDSSQSNPFETFQNTLSKLKQEQEWKNKKK